MEKNCKPFDPEAAKNGAKVVTRDGRPARIICWDLANNSEYNYKLVALIKDEDGNEYIIPLKDNGMYEDRESNSDLFMSTEKHEWYVSVFRDPISGGFIVNHSEIRSSKEECRFERYDGLKPIATAKIEWEE